MYALICSDQPISVSDSERFLIFTLHYCLISRKSRISRISRISRYKSRRNRLFKTYQSLLTQAQFTLRLARKPIELWPPERDEMPGIGRRSQQNRRKEWTPAAWSAPASRLPPYVLFWSGLYPATGRTLFICNITEGAGRAVNATVY